MKRSLTKIIIRQSGDPNSLKSVKRLPFKPQAGTLAQPKTLARSS